MRYPVKLEIFKHKVIKKRVTQYDFLPGMLCAQDNWLRADPL
jgi:hypothetical protein